MSNLIFERVADQGHPLASAVEQLYLDAFPLEERKPIQDLYAHQVGQASDVWAVNNEVGDFIGLAVTLLSEQLVLIEYLAVNPAMRNNQYGAKILAHMSQLYPDKPLFLEIEPTQDLVDQNDIRWRRRRFYERNGYKFINQTIRYFDIELELMSTHDWVDEASYLKPYQLTYGANIRDQIYYLGSTQVNND
ncbi:GNAT family N-acetyltransferase [Vaginisenegalia massiliensis]|uniref:GNAT family N-acetyltransferase n=1 Tax=Vaginisenegalia massiliensis TaxID=2058294 RepID=UPI000F53AFB3|nr:GNAT family N-acetyltransferase [Vaginisenegalia massiliensis]